MKNLQTLWAVPWTISVALLVICNTASGVDVTRLVEDLESSDSRKRRNAAYELHQLGSDAVDALPALIKALDDDQDQVFFHAVSAIATIGPQAEAAIPALISRLGPVRRRYGEQINLRAAFALSRIGKSAVGPLIIALEESDETLCANAIEALALMPPEVSLPAMGTLITLLGDDRDRVSESNVKALSNFGVHLLPAVTKILKDGNEAEQRDAIRTLGLIGKPASASAPEIVEAAQSGKPTLLIASLDALVRLRHDPAETTGIIVSALGSDEETIANAGADAALLLVQVYPSLDAAPFAEAVATAEVPVQLRFASVLGRMGTAGTPAVPALIAATEKSSDPATALAFAEALGGIGKTAAPLLIDSAGTLPLEELTETAWPVAALSYIGTPALPALQQGLNSENGSCRKASVIALGLLGTNAAPATDALFAILKDPESDVRGHALVALPRTGVSSERMLPVLEPLTADASGAVRAQAFRAMGNIKDGIDRSLPLLIKGMSDPDLAVQTGAIEAIGNLRASAASAVPSLKAVLDNSSTEAIESRERAAISALGSIGAPAKDAVPSIVSYLDSTTPDVRILTLSSLGAIGADAKTALPEVRSALADRTPEVRAQAVEAIAKIETDKKVLTDALMSVLQDHESSVREVAISRLGAIGEDARPAAPKLFEILASAEDPQPIIDALRTIRTREYELYVAVLSSKSPSVRLFACESLGRFGSRASSALPELKKLRDDEYDFVRRRADRAIERINRRR